MVKLRAGQTLRDALEYEGIPVNSGLSISEAKKTIEARVANRELPGISSVEEAEQMRNHMALSPYEGCGNYPVNMSLCETVGISGSCPGTQFCIFSDEPEDGNGLRPCRDWDGD